MSTINFFSIQYAHYSCIHDILYIHTINIYSLPNNKRDTHSHAQIAFYGTFTILLLLFMIIAFRPYPLVEIFTNILQITWQIADISNLLDLVHLYICVDCFRKRQHWSKRLNYCQISLIYMYAIAIYWRKWTLMYQ